MSTIALVAGSLNALAHAVETDGYEDVKLPRLSQRSRMLAADGAELATVYSEDRVMVSLDAIPDVVRNAVISVEDSGFYEHEGVSVPGVARALRRNTEQGRVAQGGSTITQQVVKNDLLKPDRTLSRKLRESILAHQLEQQYSKDEILERYLNTVYFGAGAHGIYTAAQRYFGKDLAEIDLAEAALIAGQIASPATFNPFRHPERSAARRAHVLGRMVAEGFISKEEAAAARQQPLPTQLHTRPAQPDDYFSEEVRRQLLRDPRLGETRAERRDALLSGGLTIHTTLDRRLQALAEAAVNAHLPDSEFTASLVSVNPANGDVVAVVGGPGFERAKYNLATQGARQPGSSFKPIALAAALSNGYTTGDQVITKAPCVFDMPEGQDPWRVLNYDGAHGGGVMTLRDATVRSSNCAYARLSMDLGPEKIAAMARQLGITRHPYAVPSIALGALEASPLEMAAVNAAFAAQGIYHVPRFYTKVEGPDGKVLFENPPAARQAMHHDVALVVTDVLTNVIQRGTGRAADIGRPAAGKTGTSQEWRDAWFNGFTPFLATSVWMGHPEGQVSMRNVAGRRVTGGSFPARIWAAYMAPASEPYPALGFHPPPPEGASDWIGEKPEPPKPPPKRDRDRDEGGGGGNGGEGNGGEGNGAEGNRGEGNRDDD